MNIIRKITFFLILVTTGIQISGQELKLIETFAGENVLVPSKIVIADDLVYILDRGDLTIKMFSKDQKLLRTIGKKGEGPGEFLNATDFMVKDDKIYVLDKFKMDVFSNREGKLLKSKKFATASPNRFCINAHELYLTSLAAGQDSNIIHKLSNNDEENNLISLISFRKSTPATNGMLDIYRNFGTIVFWQGKICYAPMISNSICLYSTDGQESASYSIPITPVDLKDIKLKQTSKGFQVNLDKGVLVDLFTSGPDLFLLAYDNNGASVIYVWEKEGPTINKRFQPHETLISCAVNGDELWAVGMSNDIEILRYKIL